MTTSAAKKTYQSTPLDRDSSKPLYIQLAEAVTKYIEKTYVKPGDPLPSENDLMKQYNVSRITVRGAMNRLVTEGLVHKVHGKGVFVSENRLNYIAGISTLEESFAERGMKIESELLESQLFYPAAIYLDALGLDRGSRVFKIKRLKKVDGKPFCIEVRHLPMDVANRFKLEDLGVKPEVDLLSQYPETEIHSVEYKIRSEFLLEKNAVILQTPVDTPVIIQFSTHYNLQEQPVMASKRTYPAEKIDIRFKIHKNGKMLA